MISRRTNAFVLAITSLKYVRSQEDLTSLVDSLGRHIMSLFVKLIRYVPACMQLMEKGESADARLSDRLYNVVAVLDVLGAFQTQKLTVIFHV